MINQSLLFIRIKMYNKRKGEGEEMNTDEVMKKVRNRKVSLLGIEKYKQYAVLLPLVDVNDESHILFEVRSKQMRSQPGDVCFPGGRMDQTDFNEQYCAVRETSEELGVDRSIIKDVTPLDYIVSDHGRIIYPFVGKLATLETLNINKAEVDEVFTVPLSFFLHTRPKVYKINLKVIPEENFPYDLIQGGENYDWRMKEIDELFYKYNDQVIWGLTAKILTHFIRILKVNDGIKI